MTMELQKEHHAVEKFDPLIEFVILIHPIESRRRIATGRMAYQSLENAHIVRGCQFPDNPIVNKLLAEEGYKNIILSPGENATNLTGMEQSEISQHFPKSQKLRIFVLDGTWSNAGKMFSRSPNLQKLPRYFFIPDKPSNIRVRKQPNEKCYCTLEAVHHSIELIGPSQGLDVKSRTHDKLFKPFDWMIEQQLERIEKNRNWRVKPRQPDRSPQ